MFIRIVFAILNLLITQDQQLIVFFRNKNSDFYKNLDVLSDYLKKSNLKVVVVDNSFKFILKIYYFIRAKIIFLDQADPVISHLKKDKNKTVIQLWHAGGAYKCFGFDAIRKEYSLDFEKNRISRIHLKYDYVVVSSENVKDCFKSAFLLEYNQILPYGIPRTDLLVRDIGLGSGKELLKQRLQLNSKKNILFCPTFRTINNKRETAWQSLNFISDSIKQNYNILVKLHPSVRNNLMIKNYIDVSQFDLYDVLSITDILVTDYSSILFDFSFFRKPIILYIHDLMSYKDNQRNLYFLPEEIVDSRMIAHNEADLLACIENPIVSNVWDTFMEKCDGNSCKRILNLIFNLVKNNKLGI